MKKIMFALLTCGLSVGQNVAAADFGGEYSLQTPAGVIQLSLEQDDAGQLSGSMSDGVSSFRLLGQIDGDTASGYVKAEYPPDLAFTANFDQSANQLLMQIYPFDSSGGAVVAMARNLTFIRNAGSAAAPAIASEQPRQEPVDNSAASNVIVNRKALTRAQVASFEQQYQTRLIDGRFWYDDKCGAWGIEGGPAVGFILPSLPLPGPMPANASGGGTGIFINGRELHPTDRQVLIGMFGTALPGRYWLDAYGNLGVEGGGFLVNLAAAALKLQQRTTQTGSGTVSSGPAGAMFSGRNLSTGKPTFWYAGM